MKKYKMLITAFQINMSCHFSKIKKIIYLLKNSIYFDIKNTLNLIYLNIKFDYKNYSILLIIRYLCYILFFLI